MAAAPQSGGGQPESATGILWVVAGTFVLLGILWAAFKTVLIHAYFSVKLAEISFISFFTHRLDDVRTTILMSDASKVTFQDMVRVGSVVGDYLRYPLVLILVVLAVLVYFNNSTRVFKRIYSMRDLAQLEKDNWPQITPVVGLDLINTDIDKGPWAMALTPMQFAKRYKLLEEYKRGPQEGLTRKEWNRIEVKLKRGEANRVFTMQVGPLFQGINKLPMHVRALFAVFAARFYNDGKSAAELLSKISASSATKLDFSGAIELSQKYEATKLVKEMTEHHAYMLTFMASMLEAAREDGVQASADFLWLKPVDRRLWYMLNNVGRQTSFVEVAGPFAHWMAEKELGRKLIIPMVEEATNGLEIALKEIVYRPDEE